MRNMLLATAAAFGLALAAPAWAPARAQSAAPTDPATTTDQAPPAATAPDAGTMAPTDGGMASPHAMKKHHHKTASGGGEGKFAHEPGTGESGPASMKASNTDQANSHSDIAPHFPMPKAGHDATADAYLGAAQRALRAHHTGEAQQALEMAETRLLDRSTPAGTAGTPASDPQVMKVSEARHALGQGDVKAASLSIKMALATSTTGGSSVSDAGSMSPPAAGPAPK